jgi:hypothetical protein
MRSAWVYGADRRRNSLIWLNFGGQHLDADPHLRVPIPVHSTGQKA